MSSEIPVEISDEELILSQDNEDESLNTLIGSKRDDLLNRKENAQEESYTAEAVLALEEKFSRPLGEKISSEEYEIRLNAYGDVIYLNNVSKGEPPQRVTKDGEKISFASEKTERDTEKFLGPIEFARDLIANNFTTRVDENNPDQGSLTSIIRKWEHDGITYIRYNSESYNASSIEKIGVEETTEELSLLSLTATQKPKEVSVSDTRSINETAQTSPIRVFQEAAPELREEQEAGEQAASFVETDSLWKEVFGQQDVQAQLVQEWSLGTQDMGQTEPAIAESLVLFPPTLSVVTQQGVEAKPMNQVMAQMKEAAPGTQVVLPYRLEQVTAEQGELVSEALVLQRNESSIQVSFIEAQPRIFKLEQAVALPREEVIQKTSQEAGHGVVLAPPVPEMARVDIVIPTQAMFLRESTVAAAVVVPELPLASPVELRNSWPNVSDTVLPTVPGSTRCVPDFSSLPTISLPEVVMTPVSPAEMEQQAQEKSTLNVSTTESEANTQAVLRLVTPTLPIERLSERVITHEVREVSDVLHLDKTTTAPTVEVAAVAATQKVQEIFTEPVFRFIDIESQLPATEIIVRDETFVYSKIHKPANVAAMAAPPRQERTSAATARYKPGRSSIFAPRDGVFASDTGAGLLEKRRHTTDSFEKPFIPALRQLADGGVLSAPNKVLAAIPVDQRPEQAPAVSKAPETEVTVSITEEGIDAVSTVSEVKPAIVGLEAFTAETINPPEVEVVPGRSLNRTESIPRYMSVPIIASEPRVRRVIRITAVDIAGTPLLSDEETTVRVSEGRGEALRPAFGNAPATSARMRAAAVTTATQAIAA